VYASRAELDAWARGRNLSSGARERRRCPFTHSAAVAPRSRNPPLYLADDVLRMAAVIAGWRLAVILWLQKTEYFWRNPIGAARFQTARISMEWRRPAAVSRDGHFVAFLSDRDGQMDVWCTQAGSGEFHNLTRGSAPELVNPSVRTLGFTPDGSLVTFWFARRMARAARYRYMGGATLGDSEAVLEGWRVRLVA